MRSTQGTFSFLPDLSDDEIKAQVDDAIENGWAIAVEFTDDPHPRNSYWDMWDLPMFEIEDSAEVHDRKMNDTIRPYAHREPKGERYQGNGKG